MVDGGPAALVFFRSHTRTELERSVLRSDALVGGRVGETVEVLIEHLREPRFVWGRSQEQRHRRMEFQRIDLAEDLVRVRVRRFQPKRPRF